MLKLICDDYNCFLNSKQIELSDMLKTIKMFDPELKEIDLSKSIVKKQNLKLVFEYICAHENNKGFEFSENELLLKHYKIKEYFGVWDYNFVCSLIKKSDKLCEFMSLYDCSVFFGIKGLSELLAFTYASIVRNKDTKQISFIRGMPVECEILCDENMACDIDEIVDEYLLKGYEKN